MRTRTAFTLVELLVVIAIIIALLAILMPSMGRAIDLAQRSVCVSNTHQQALAFLNYASDFNGVYPTADNKNKGGNQWILNSLYVVSNAQGRALRTRGWTTDEPDISGDPVPSDTIMDCPSSVGRPRGFLTYTLLHVDEYVVLTDLNAGPYASTLNSPARVSDPIGALTACHTRIDPTGGSWAGNHPGADGQPEGFPQSFSDVSSRWIDASDLPVNGNDVPLATYDSGWPWKWVWQERL